MRSYKIIKGYKATIIHYLAKSRTKKINGYSVYVEVIYRRSMGNYKSRFILGFYNTLTEVNPVLINKDRQLFFDAIEKIDNNALLRKSFSISKFITPLAKRLSNTDKKKLSSLLFEALNCTSKEERMAKFFDFIGFVEENYLDK